MTKPYSIDRFKDLSDAASTASRINQTHPEWAGQCWLEVAWLAFEREQYGKMIKYVNRAYRAWSRFRGSVGPYTNQCCTFSYSTARRLEQEWFFRKPFKDYALYAVRKDGTHKVLLGRYACPEDRARAQKDLLDKWAVQGYRVEAFDR